MVSVRVSVLARAFGAGFTMVTLWSSLLSRLHSIGPLATVPTGPTDGPTRAEGPCLHRSLGPTASGGRYLRSYRGAEDLRAPVRLDRRARSARRRADPCYGRRPPHGHERVALLVLRVREEGLADPLLHPARIGRGAHPDERAGGAARRYRRLPRRAAARPDDPRRPAALGDVHLRRAVRPRPRGAGRAPAGRARHPRRCPRDRLRRALAPQRGPAGDALRRLPVPERAGLGLPDAACRRRRAAAGQHGVERPVGVAHRVDPGPRPREVRALRRLRPRVPRPLLRLGCRAGRWAVRARADGDRLPLLQGLPALRRVVPDRRAREDRGDRGPRRPPSRPALPGDRRMSAVVEP